MSSTNSGNIQIEVSGMLRSLIVLNELLFLPNGDLAFVDGLDLTSVDGKTRSHRLAYTLDEPMPTISCLTESDNRMIITKERDDTNRVVIRVQLDRFEYRFIFEPVPRAWRFAS